MLNLKKPGVAGYEIFCSQGSSTSLTFSGGEIRTREISAEQGYGIRVLKDRKLGFAFCERESGINDATARAARLSRYSPETGFVFAKKRRVPKVKSCDRKVARLEPKELAGLLAQVRGGLEKHAKKSRVNISCGSEEVSLSNSEGFDCSYVSSSFSVYAEGMKEDGFGFSYADSVRLPDDLEAIGEEAGMMAKSMMGAKKIKKGKYTVLFEQAALDELLNVLLPSFSGDRIRKKASRLYGRLGEQAFCREFTLADSGLAEGSEARPFDDEGVVSKERVLVEKGVVRGFIYDRETAALAKVRQDGFCSRAHYSSSPGSGNSNILISPGEYRNIEEESKGVLVVHSLHGSHTANTTTGDFGMEVNVAFHNGKPARGFMLSANIFKLLEGNILLEKDVQAKGNLVSPRVAFEGVQVIS